MGEETFDLGTAHLFRMSLAVEEDEPLDPKQIRLLGAHATVLRGLRGRRARSEGGGHDEARRVCRSHGSYWERCCEQSRAPRRQHHRHLIGHRGRACREMGGACEGHPTADIERGCARPNGPSNVSDLRDADRGRGPDTKKECDVFVTVDRNLSFQQNLPAFEIAVIVLRAASNRLADLQHLVPELLASIPIAKRGAVTYVGV